MSSIEWETPQNFFDTLNREFGFTLDVCAFGHNAKCNKFFCPQDNGLSKKWEGTCWCNPPFDKTMGEWIKKAHCSAQKGATVVCLFPGNYHDNKWWHNFVMRSSEIRYIRGRLKFIYLEKLTSMRTVLVVFRPYCKGPPLTSSIDTKGNRLSQQNIF